MRDVTIVYQVSTHIRIQEMRDVSRLDLARMVANILSLTDLVTMTVTYGGVNHGEHDEDQAGGSGSGSGLEEGQARVDP